MGPGRGGLKYTHNWLTCYLITLPGKMGGLQRPHNEPLIETENHNWHLPLGAVNPVDIGSSTAPLSHLPVNRLKTMKAKVSTQHSNKHFLQLPVR